MSTLRSCPDGPLWAPSSGCRGCRAPSDATEEVVALESTTGESNPNASSWREDAAPAVGVLCECAAIECMQARSAMDDMRAMMMVPIKPRSVLG